jgi:DNA-binding transcriptional regulator YdaS (Cro superfamily)
MYTTSDTNMNPLLQYWLSLDPSQKRALAELCGTSVGSLHQAAHAYRTAGELTLSPELARDIELALGGTIRREQMCPACAKCEYAINSAPL